MNRKPLNLRASVGFRQWIESVRTVPVWFVLLTLLVICALFTVAVVLLVGSPALKSMARATYGVIGSNFLLGASLVVVLLLLCLGVGRMRLGDLGITRSRILPAIAWTAVGWVILQLAALMNHEGALALDPAWRTATASKLGNFVFGFVFGVALFEELFFRGFLLVQLTRLIQRLRCSTRWSLAVGILGSSILFAICHLPHRFLHDSWISINSPIATLLQDQLILFVAALVMTLFFVLTNNILVAVGIHALMDAPMLLFAGTSEGIQAWLLLLLPVFAAMTAWRWRKAGKRGRGPAPRPLHSTT